MATTKAKKAPVKKAPVKKTAAKKAPAKKAVVKKAAPKKTVRTAATTRRPFVTRTDEYTQLTWVLISIWLILIAIFLGTVIGKTG